MSLGIEAVQFISSPVFGWVRVKPWPVRELPAGA